MNISENVKGIFTSLLEQLGMAVWIEIVTESPRCTYYFGPFGSTAEAEEEQPGYIEDLRLEGATGIVALIKRCKPDDLTIFDESIDMERERTPSLSGHSY